MFFVIYLFLLFFPFVFGITYCIKEKNVLLNNTCPALTDFSPTLFPPSKTQMMTSSTPIKPFSSFEEWQQRIDTRQRPRSPKVVGQQVIDSIDGGLSDDLGAMFENILSHQKPNNVYEKQQYISPIGNKPKKQEDNLKYLKERFNYASVDCAATVRKANKEAKGAQSILFESKDQYLLNRCLANKFVIINLCEQIRVDTIVMANFEFFSSTFKDFKVYGSAKYPSDDWWLLGQWQARNTRDLQVFRVPESPWTNYIKIEFLTHYGHEYYCPLSLVRVHGMSMMELYTNIESNDDESPTPEHLWPAEIREQIIQPQYDIVNSSESFPIKVEEEDVPIVIPPVVNDTEEMPTEEQMEMPEENIEKIEKTVTTSAVMTLSGESTCAQRNTIMPLPVNKPSQELIEQPSMIDSNDRNHELNMTSMGSPVTNTVSHTSTQETSTSNLTEDNRPMITQHKIHHSKETTQESIYKTIMKRLSVLEHNMTLSQRFLDEQNKVLNDVFLEMERKHQEQLIVLIEHLNGTASQKIETMKRRYEQWYADMKEQTENEMKEMNSKVNSLSDQISFERKVSITQLIITIILFVYMALSSGTLNTLSPVIAAQLKERKKRKETKLFIDTKNTEEQQQQVVPRMNSA